jgi:leader peptidase (prepilin peptidase) / N-methyltransferase
VLLTLTLSLCAGGYGAAVGALLPRTVYRFAVRREQPRLAHCPDGHPLPRTPRGWLGPARCAQCVSDGSPGAVYGPRARWLLLTGATVCAALAATVGPRPELAVWLLVAPFGLLLAAVDLRVRRLPDVLTLPLAVATAALLGLASILPGANGSWEDALLGGVVLAGSYLVLFLVHPRGFGFGDVKLALTAGVALGWYGWQALFAGAFLGFLLQAGWGAALIVAGRAGRKTALPFGPFMVLGAALTVLLAGAGI